MGPEPRGFIAKGYRKGESAVTDKTAKRKKKSIKSTKVPANPEKLRRKAYEKELERLHVELVKLQRWVVHKGLKVCIVFEGRDGAGKGGVIKAITERVSPRIFRVVALPAPTEREKTQLYFQRYLKHFPAAGEIVIFDRSWYNRAGIERVMKFCTEDEAEHFLRQVPMMERAMVDSDIILLKYWLEVSPEEQQRRLEDRVDDGRKTWKLSEMDLKSYHRWDAYTQAREAMFNASDSSWAPWFVARSEDKKRVRLNVISDLLERIPYKELPLPQVKLGKRRVRKNKAAQYPAKYVPERY
jgi:polyphosphate kinase 2